MPMNDEGKADDVAPDTPKATKMEVPAGCTACYTAHQYISCSLMGYIPARTPCPHTCPNVSEPQV
jgi:hypothetical protein